MFFRKVDAFMQKGLPLSARARNIVIIVTLVVLMIFIAVLLFNSCSRRFTDPFFSTDTARRAEDGSTLFMSYEGPVFPLSALYDTDGITATRNIVLDFSNFGTGRARPESYRFYSDIFIFDNYVLTNVSGTDRVLQLIYPFAGSFSEYGRFLPVVSKNGIAVSPQLLAGTYSGSFVGFEDGDGLFINLGLLDSWQDYYALLSDGKYLQRVLGDTHALNYPVIVYEFTDITADFYASVNPTLAVGFTLDYDRTTVLSYGFHGASFEPDNQFMRQGFSVPRGGFYDENQIFKLIILGDDISDINMQGYANGGWHPGQEREDISALMTRRETTLCDVLGELVAGFAAIRSSVNDPSASIFDFYDIPAETAYEMFLRAVSELLFDYGMLSDEVASRYEMGWLADMFWEVFVMPRVLYLSFDVPILDGESVQINFDMVKAGSFDFFTKGSSNQGLYGYDIVTTLGSAFSFIEQSVRLEGGEYVEIVRQNFGFEPDGDSFFVNLSQYHPRYFIEVRSSR